MDSKLVVEQMKGNWQVKNPALRALAQQAVALRQPFDDVTFEWIPREQNKHADRLANEAMDRAAGKPPRAARATAARTRTPTPMWTPPAGDPTRLVLVRHGATKHSAQWRFSGRNDLPLDALGERQAAALATRNFGNVAAVVSSPLRRARQTAAAIAAPLGLDVLIDDGFAEVDFGAWEGLTMAEARARDAAAVDAWLGSVDVAPPNGESFAALGRRVRTSREAVIAAHPGVGRRGRHPRDADQDARALRARRAAAGDVPVVPRYRVGLGRRLLPGRQLRRPTRQRHRSPDAKRRSP